MAKGKNLRKIKTDKSVHFQVEEEPPDYGKLRPIFSFFHMRYGKNYCLSKCSRVDRSEIATALLQISQLSWDEILSVERKSFGLEHIPIKQFNAKVFPKIVTPDVQALLVFSYSHGGRMAGIRQTNIFHILLVGDDLYSH
jgi:hypothetical protein